MPADRLSERVDRAMCTAPHESPFGRCACALAEGHEGPHTCKPTADFGSTPGGER